MDEKAIRELFARHIGQRSAVKVFNISKETVSRIRRDGTTFGTMLSLLFQAGFITITANESTGTKE